MARKAVERELFKANDKAYENYFEVTTFTESPLMVEAVIFLSEDVRSLTGMSKVRVTFKYPSDYPFSPPRVFVRDYFPSRYIIDGVFWPTMWIEGNWNPSFQLSQFLLSINVALNELENIILPAFE